MAKRSRPTFQKRQKEQARQQKQQAKAARRLQAKQRRADGTSEPDESTLDMADNQLDPQSFPAATDDMRS